jgi:hypothetical protein
MDEVLLLAIIREPPGLRALLAQPDGGMEAALAAGIKNSPPNPTA